MVRRLAWVLNLGICRTVGSDQLQEQYDDWDEEQLDYRHCKKIAQMDNSLKKNQMDN